MKHLGPLKAPGKDGFQGFFYRKYWHIVGVQVCDDASINFWCNKWFPGSPDLYIPNAKGPFRNNSYVSDFISNGNWDLVKLGSVVADHTVHDISLIPLSRTGVSDKLWRRALPHLLQMIIITYGSSFGIFQPLQKSKCFYGAFRIMLLLHLVKYNCDVSFKDGKASDDILGRNNIGTIIYGNGSLVKASSPLHAEILAIREGCNLPQQRQFHSAYIESDSLVAISLASSDKTPPWHVAAVVEDIRALASILNSKFYFIPRLCNAPWHIGLLRKLCIQLFL
ncbi:hypothetical protein POM88_014111 [Heracleum sosnowskyi]|uniref:RNase H type-1 domain-containing protein n=1 Tax=Heracleum sosnowskyi TaxID=360622 RepID=A0AAD8MYQ5_9APIA|nr:hypothetical protein POM88_014111 [Heracleum sosnowskyi]